MAGAVLGQIEGGENPLVMFHDYHLYTAPGMIRERRRRLPAPLRPRPLVAAHGWRILPNRIREAIFEEMLANDIIGFHTHAYCIDFLRCCDELLRAPTSTTWTREVRYAGRLTLARAYPLGSTPSGWSGQLNLRRWRRPSARCSSAGAST